jgi:hypothetical protein
VAAEPADATTGSAGSAAAALWGTSGSSCTIRTTASSAGLGSGLAKKASLEIAAAIAATRPTNAALRSRIGCMSPQDNRARATSAPPKADRFGAGPKRCWP